MTPEEIQEVVKYLRMSPCDSLKRSAADIIEAQANEIERLESDLSYAVNN